MEEIFARGTTRIPRSTPLVLNVLVDSAVYSADSTGYLAI